MSLKRVAVLLVREVVQGPKNFIFIFALIVPIVITLLVTLLFGTLFSGNATLGFVDAGSSRLVQMAREVDAVIVETYGSAQALREAVQDGQVDVGVALPAGFDEAVREGRPVEVVAYIWGQSLLRHRTAAATTLATLIRDLAGQESPVEIVTTPVGEGESVPWDQRLMPFIVLMAVLIGGIFVPATSLVEEKQRRTLAALTVTPTTLWEVLTAKGLLGAVLSVVVGVTILALNRSFGSHPFLLAGLLALGGALAAIFGMLLGLLVKDVNTLFAAIKGIGIFLYAPALIYLFPEIPQWIGRIFPTYYIVQPVVEISQRGAGWAEVAPDVAILCVLIALLLGVVYAVTRRQTQAGVLAAG